MKRMPKAEMTVKDLANKETSGECTTSVCRLGFPSHLLTATVVKSAGIKLLVLFFSFLISVSSI